MIKRLPLIHIALFVTTCATTLLAGAIYEGVNPFAHPGRIWAGLPFAATLMTILLFHEFGHYFAARANGVSATLPYFIPVPPLQNVLTIGTMGAFIKMTSPITSRRALVEIGSSGPIVGFVVSVIASAIGLSMSRVVILSAGQQSLVLGESLLFWLMRLALIGPLPEGADVLLHPVAFAGWIGFFVTTLNLIPIGQLDGGHILYAFLGPRQKRVGIVLVGLLAALGLFYWPGWTVWAVLMLILGIEHPPVLWWERPMDRRRRLMGLASLLIFLLTFMPMPFSIK